MRAWISCTLVVTACGAPPVQTQTPVETAERMPNHAFVATATPVCPTAEQALARECGNSVEFDDQGYWLRVGERIDVAPTSDPAVFSSTRWMVSGPQPGFVASKDLAFAPKIAPVTEVPWTDVGWHRFEIRGTARVEGTVHEGTAYPNEPLTLVTPLGPMALSPCLENADGTYLEDVHSCLAERDCVDLSWGCDATFCDEVWIQTNEVGEISGISDRFGVFEVRECGRY